MSSMKKAYKKGPTCDSYKAIYKLRVQTHGWCGYCAWVMDLHYITNDAE